MVLQENGNKYKLLLILIFLSLSNFLVITLKLHSNRTQNIAIFIWSTSKLIPLQQMMSHIRKLSNPAGERNKAPILEVLQKFLDKTRPNQKLLEISSGVGLHAAYFASHFPQIHYQPSEYDTSLFGSIEAYRAEAQAPNLQSPVPIDISQPCTDWTNDHGINFANSGESYDYMLNINMMHISPFHCSEGLFWNASRLLKQGGLLITYGPYAVDGKLTPESNVQFDASLKYRNPSWGIRDVRELEKLSNTNGITLKQMFDLPANNKCLIWEKVKGLQNY